MIPKKSDYAGKLKIRIIVYLGDFETDGRTTVMGFFPTEIVADITAAVRKKVGLPNLDDYVLFHPREKKYFHPDQTLKSYEVADDDLVEFRSRFKTLKVELEDGSVRTVKIDDTRNVEHHIATIGEKLKIRHYQEFCLKRPDSLEWLKPDQTLPAQDIAPNSDEQLVFGKVFYIYDNTVTKEDAAELNLLYQGSVAKFVTGELPCTKADALLVAPLALQAQHLDWTSGNVDAHLEHVFPAQFIPKGKKDCAELFDQITTDWKKLKGLTSDDARYKVLQVLRGLPTYGVTVFSVERKTSEKKKKGKGEPLKLCVSKNKLMFLDPETNEQVKAFKLQHLKRWGSSGDGIMFDFSTYDPDQEYQRFITAEKVAISDLIEGYIKLLLKRAKGMSGTLKRSEQVVARTRLAGSAKAAMGDLLTGDSAALIQDIRNERALHDPLIRMKKLVEDMSGGGPTSEQLLRCYDLMKATCQLATGLLAKTEAPPE